MIFVIYIYLGCDIRIYKRFWCVFRNTTINMLRISDLPATKSVARPPYTLRFSERSVRRFANGGATPRFNCDIRKPLRAILSVAIAILKAYVAISYTCCYGATACHPSELSKRVINANRYYKCILCCLLFV